MKIPFDIKYRDKIESGEFKVETRDGRPARIICWDKESILPIVALVKEIESEKVVSFTESGDCPGTLNCYDLFIVTPEPEMAEFEKRLFEIRHIAKRDMYSDQEWQTLRNESAELLSLAKSQLLQSGEFLTQEHHEKLMETLHEECKRGLPRWRQVEADKEYPGCIARYMDINGDWNYCMSSGKVSDDCEYISFAELERLPKDEDHE